MSRNQDSKVYIGLVDTNSNPPDGYDEYLWMSSSYVRAIEWCQENNKPYDCLPEIWNTLDDIQKADLYLDSVSDIVIDILSKTLNIYHETSYSNDEWRVLLLPWIRIYLTTYYDKYLRVKMLPFDGHIDLVNIDRYNPAFDFLDWQDMCFDSDEFNSFLYSRIISELDMKGNHDITEREYKRDTFKYRDEDSKRRKELIESNIKYKEKASAQDEVVIQSEYIQYDLCKQIMNEQTGIVTAYFSYYFGSVRNSLIHSIKVDNESRRRITVQLSQKEQSDNFVNLIIKLLLGDLPIVYFELFKDLKQIKDDIFRFAQNPKAVIFDASGVVDSELFKLYLMEISHKKPLKIDVQHGGDYGIMCDREKIDEIELCDVFLTSGWTVEKNDKFHPMPFVKFFRMQKYNKMKGDRILYVSYSVGKYVHRIYPYEMLIYKYIDSGISFLRHAIQDLGSPITVRLSENDHGWDLKKRIESEISGVVFDEIKDFYESVAKSRLVICELMSTTWIEALYLDKPILILMNPNIRTLYIMKNAQEDIEDLIRVGVIVESPELLARRIGVVEKNLTIWWREKKRQQVISKIKKKYAMFSDDAAQIWIDYISSLIAAK